MTYEEIVERAASAAKPVAPQVDIDHLRVVIDIEFSTVLEQVSDTFAGTSQGDMLRQDVPLTFVSGFVTAPDKVLLKHLKRGRLYTSDVNAFYSHEREGTDLANLDRRLGYWKLNGVTIEAVTPTDGIGLDGSATLNTPCVPDTPTLYTDQFTGPADMIPELIDALAAKAVGVVRMKAA